MRRQLLVVAALYSATTASQPVLAGPPPEGPPKVEPGQHSRNTLLFPAPSELAARLRSTGIQVKSLADLNEKLPVPAWSSFTLRQKELQLGSVLGYLGVAVVTSDTPAIQGCLGQVLAGAESLGIDKKSNAYVTTSRLRDDIKKGKVNQTKLLGSLDAARRDTLRELGDRADAAVVLAAAWLRGSSLLVRDVDSDGQAKRLAEFVLRPELLGFIGNLADTGAPIDVSAEAKKISALATKKDFNRDDLRSFASFANAVLQSPKAKP